MTQLMRARRPRRLAAAVVIAVLAIGAAACQPLYGDPGPFDVHAITDHGTDGYRYRWAPTTDIPGRPLTAAWDNAFVGRGVVSVTDNSGNQSGDNRQVAPVLGAVASQDHGSCATILGPVDGVVQPGVALRIRTDGDRTRAITVTNNVWLGGRFIFNVHLADSGGATFSDQMSPLGGFNPPGFATSVADLPPLPWRLCARVQGQQVRVKAWAPGRTAEPTYADPRFGATFTVPPTWVFTGKPGFYVGHLGVSQGTYLGIDQLEQTQG